MKFASTAVTFLSAVAAASAAAIDRRAVIAHDAVVGFPETVPDDNLGRIYLKYKPYLKVVNGCVPFPAVDAEGNTRYASGPTQSYGIRGDSNWWF